MAKNTRRKSPQGFTVVARGIRRVDPDFVRLMKASVDHHREASDPTTTPHLEDQP